MFKTGFLLALGYYCARGLFNIIGDCFKRMLDKINEAEQEAKKKEADAQKPKEVKKTGRIVVSGFGREL